ncbi:hypothetical protein Mal64_28750 [Pseudobythopirellula maris]|uniref:Uncharacterized protein n=1 Tax=Pseudobythopirellula maris TaxID=2527991 RepID=A0A5C5ZJW5_9BACT|nr:hypothetical protein [Pseudobythopirellula maris]TWT87337.1 hypothetical protein Mal64_28750 [Pseudobythopirellula maris]
MHVARGLFLIVAFAVILPCSHHQAIGHETSDSNPPKHNTTFTSTVSVADLERTDVIGRLGKPLGSLVTVEGVYEFREDNPNTKADKAAVLLKIETVNGEPVGKSPIVYQYIPDRMLDASDPAPNSRFKLIGYQTGEFRGDVRGAGQHIATVAKLPIPFGLHLEFHVLKDELKSVSRKDLGIR